MTTDAPTPSQQATPPAGVRVAGPADRDRLAVTLARAFADDPVFSWLIPPAARRRDRRLRTAFAALMSRELAAGTTYAAPADVGAAVWAAPGQWRTPLSQILRSAAPLVRAFGAGIPRSLRVLSAMERVHPREPAWYLAILGTDPEHQGKGIGTALLRPVLERCDTEGIGGYLESSNPRNLTLYRRNGFAVVAEMPLPGGGPPLYRMWRDPGAGPQ